MAESSDALHSDEIPWHRAAMAQSVERGDSGAHERRGFGRVKRLRHVRHRFHRCDHEFLIAAVITDAGHQTTDAIDEVSSPARLARAVLSTVPAHADAVSFVPALHASAGLVDGSGNFVSGNARIRNSG